MLFCVISFIVQAIVLVKCPLFILGHVIPQVLTDKKCPGTNGSEERIGQDYLFTMIAFSGLLIGCWAEVLILHIHIYKFLFSQSIVKVRKFQLMCRKGLTKCSVLVLLLLFLIMLVQTFVSPILGVLFEIRQGQKASCEGYIYQYYIVYWILDVIILLHDMLMRLLMCFTTLATGEIWTDAKKSQVRRRK